MMSLHVLAADAQPPAKSVLDGVDRKIGKEPVYENTPKYALMVMGTNADSKVWLVEDGRKLYVDRNANGDLTDDGPPAVPEKLREMNLTGKPNSWDFEYTVEAITPAAGPAHTKFRLRRWNYGDPEDSYGLSITLGGKTPMYAGWFGTFWAAKPADVPLLHFGGPLEPRLLRFKEFAIGAGERRLSITFANRSGGPGAITSLDIDALPIAEIPDVQIDWPVKPGAEPLRTTTMLSKRCCYWEFYNDTFEPPAGATTGEAQLTIILPEKSFPFELSTTQLKVPVVAGAEKLGEK